LIVQRDIDRYTSDVSLTLCQHSQLNSLFRVQR